MQPAEERPETETPKEPNIYDEALEELLSDRSLEWVGENSEMLKLNPTLAGALESGKVEVRDIGEDLKAALAEPEKHTEEHPIIRKGSIAFRDSQTGNFVIVSPPYKGGDITITKNAPLGAYKFAVGDGSEQKSVQVLGGAPDGGELVDLGFAVVWVHNGRANVYHRGGENTGKMTADKIPQPKATAFSGLQKQELPQYRRRGLRVYLVNSEFVENNQHLFGQDAADFAEGGHHGEYEWIPRNEVWIARSSDDVEKKSLVKKLEEKWRMDNEGLTAEEAEMEVVENPENVDEALEKSLNRWQPLQGGAVPAYYRRQYEPRITDAMLREVEEGGEGEFAGVGQQPSGRKKDKEDEGEKNPIIRPRFYLGRRLRPPNLGLRIE